MAPSHADRCCVHPSCWDADAHASLDSAFHKQLFEIRQRTTLFKRAARIRLGLWIKKLEDAALPRHTCNLVFKKIRNAYSRLLLYSVRKGRLDFPFDGRPPEGPLPSLPTWRMASLLTGDAVNPKDGSRKVPPQIPWQHTLIETSPPATDSGAELPKQARDDPGPKPDRRHVERASAGARPASHALEEILKTASDGREAPSEDAVSRKPSSAEPITPQARLQGEGASSSGTDASPTSVGQAREGGTSGNAGDATMRMPSLLDGLSTDRAAWDAGVNVPASDHAGRGACGFHPGHVAGSKSTSSLLSPTQVGESGWASGSRLQEPPSRSMDWADSARPQGQVRADVAAAVPSSLLSSWGQLSDAQSGSTAPAAAPRSGVTSGGDIPRELLRPSSAAPAFGANSMDDGARRLDVAGPRATTASPGPSSYNAAGYAAPHPQHHTSAKAHPTANYRPSSHGDGGPPLAPSPTPTHWHASPYASYGGHASGSQVALGGASARVPSVGGSISVVDDVTADVSVIHLREINADLRWRLRRAEEAVARLEADLATTRRHVATQAKEHAKEVRRICRNHRREIEELIRSSERRWREWAPGVGVSAARAVASLLPQGGSDVLDDDGGGWLRKDARLQGSAMHAEEERDGLVSPTLVPGRRYSFQDEDDLVPGGVLGKGGGAHRGASLGGEYRGDYRGSLGGERFAAPSDGEDGDAAWRPAAMVTPASDPFLDDFELRTRMLKLKLASRA